MYKNLEKSSFHQLFSSNVLLKFYFCKGGGATCSPLMSAGGFVTFPPPPSENVGSEAMGPALQSEEGGRVSPLRTPGAAAGCPPPGPAGGVSRVHVVGLCFTVCHCLEIRPLQV